MLGRCFLCADGNFPWCWSSWDHHDDPIALKSVLEEVPCYALDYHKYIILIPICPNCIICFDWTPMDNILFPCLTYVNAYISELILALPSASPSMEAPDDLHSSLYFFCLERILCILWRQGNRLREDNEGKRLGRKGRGTNTIPMIMSYRRILYQNMNQYNSENRHVQAWIWEKH